MFFAAFCSVWPSTLNYQCHLQAMDFTGCTNLLEIRGAGNPVRSINFGPDGLPKVWHLCVRDSTNLAGNVDLSKFYSLQELFLWNCNQTGALTTATIPSTDLRDVRIHANHFEHLDFTGQKELYRLFANNNNLTNILLDGCTNLSEVLLNNNQLPGRTLDTILASLAANATGGGRVPKKLYLYNNADCPSESGRTNYNILHNQYYVDVQCDWPDTSTNSVPGGTNAITFVTGNARPHMQIAVSNATSIVWHWGDGTVETNTTTPMQPDFRADVIKTNYVIVEPPEALTAFGTYGNQGYEKVIAVSGLATFPSLTALYLWNDGLANLDITNCPSLRTLHLADNPCPSGVVNSWFYSLAAIGDISGQASEFFYPCPAATNAPSAEATNVLQSLHWNLIPFCQP